MSTNIERADDTWHSKTAAKRIGLSLEQYFAQIATGNKWCTLCKTWHSRSIFPIDKSRGDGLAASCRGRANRVPKKILTPEEKREKARESYRRYYAGAGGPKIRASKYARKRNAAPIPPWWREEQISQGCAYCDASANTLDHVVPLALGGTTEPGNLVPSCGRCNSKKKHSNPLPWLEKMREDFLERIIARPMSGMSVYEILGETKYADQN